MDEIPYFHSQNRQRCVCMFKNLALRACAPCVPFATKKPEDPCV